MRVVIRADATSAIGTGHVMRCWALAEEFQDLGWQVAWHGTTDVPWVAALVAEKGWSILPTSTKGQNLLQASMADLVVVDSYEDTRSYRQSALDIGVPVLAVVDHHHAELGPGTVWVNPGPPMDHPDSLHFLNGPDYVLIRQEIHRLANLRDEFGPGDSLTFLLGGTDAMGLADEIASLDVGQRVVAGPSDRSSGRVAWLPAGADLMRQAAQARLVVSAAGVSSWEMLHLGVPLALVLAADNQLGNYQWMTEIGWAVGLGNGKQLSKQVRDVLKSVNEGVLAGERRIDGLGAKRVVEAFLRIA